MCASYIIRTTRRQIFENFSVEIRDDTGRDHWDTLVQGFMKNHPAPVLIFKNGEYVLKEMHYSLCPRWSREYPFRASTYNARMNRPKRERAAKRSLFEQATAKPELEYIYEMPAWRASFKDRHCLVPVTSAIESSYFGRYAGHMVRFSRANKELFFAVGIWDEWTNRDTGEVIDSFTMITDDPYPFFFESGHDRSILLIESAAQPAWLENTFANVRVAYDFIQANRVDTDWQAESEREMKPGWKKRAPDDEEIAELRDSVWRKTE